MPKKVLKCNISETPDVVYYREKDVYKDENTDGSEIVNFYKGKSIFLTGATGFLGKIVVEKLLRSCDEIENIFILCREKRGKDVHTRVDDIYNDVIFERLSKLHPKFRHKITPIKGDIGLSGLGMSLEDRKLVTSKVDVIYHIAATVRFDEKLKTAMAINVRGTQEMLQLGKECENLVSFVYVSTAYANCNMMSIDERFYNLSHKVKETIEIVDSKTEEELEPMTQSLIAPWPNTYAFTKALAENVVKDFKPKLPVCVFRPAIVVSTYKEPIRGWIDNVYGPTGVVAGAGVGILRTLHCNGDNVAEIVPVDWVVNAMIVASYKTYKHTSEEIPIYNYVSSVENPITWHEYTYYHATHGVRIPTTQALWYYSLTLNKYEIIHWFYTLFLHFLPAILVDGTCLIVGKKPQLWKAYKKIHKFANVISFFSARRWYFTNDNVQKLWMELPAKDRIVFPFNMKDVDWERHAHMGIIGIRMYIVKDDPSSLPEAKKKWRRFYTMHIILKYAFYFVVLRMLYGILSIIF